MDDLDLDSLLDMLEIAKDEDTATDLGIGLFIAVIPMEEKKSYFAKAFNMDLPNEIEAIINLWAVGVMLEDDLPIPQKVSAVRGFLSDPVVKVKWINEWVTMVYDENKAPKDLLEFIAIDLRNHPEIDENLKKMLFEITP